MNKKKIAFYYPDMYVGGVEIAILNLAKRIYKDYDLYFFYRTASNLELIKEFTKYGIPRNIMTPQSEFECDTLVYCSLWVEKEDRMSFVKAKQKVLWSHAMIPSGGTKFQNLPFMRKMDRVVCVSEAANKTVPRFYYQKRLLDNLFVINNIVNQNEIKEKAELDTPKLNLARDLNICTVARLSHEKGWHRVKLMCDQFEQMGIDFKWFIIGEGYFEDETNKIHALLDKYPQIEFLGRQLNPFQYVKQMDYIALLSDFESWGLAITEGKILGKPVICTDFPAAHEQVKDKWNGVIIPMDNYRKYRLCARDIYYNKDLYTSRAKDFDFEKVNEETIRRWKMIFDSERSDKIVF